MTRGITRSRKAYRTDHKQVLVTLGPERYVAAALKRVAVLGCQLIDGVTGGDQRCR